MDDPTDEEIRDLNQQELENDLKNLADKWNFSFAVLLYVQPTDLDPCVTRVSAIVAEKYGLIPQPRKDAVANKLQNTFSAWLKRNIGR